MNDGSKERLCVRGVNYKAFTFLYDKQGLKKQEEHRSSAPRKEDICQEVQPKVALLSVF